MKRLALHWQIIIGLFIGIAWALLSSSLGWSTFTNNWIAPFGTIFINLLKLVAVPLILFSIIAGISSLGDTGKLGRLTAKTLVAYVLTTVLAVTVGLVLVNLIGPGKIVNKETRTGNRIDYELWMESVGNTDFKDDIRLLEDPALANIIATKREALTGADPVDDATSQAVREKVRAAESQKSKGPLAPLVDMFPSNIFTSLNDNTLMLQVIVFAIFFGITLLFIPGDKAAPVISLINGINEVFLKMVDVIMQAAPYFVFALMAGTLGKIAGDDPNKVVEIFKGLGWYSLTVLIGLLLVGFGIYPLIVKLITRKIPISGFYKGIGPAQLMAFSTSSSAATLPVTMDCVRENLGVSSRITSFVLPIGATVNMDGTALYQAVAVVFLAQLHMVDLNMAQQIMIVLTATLASIGSAAVPSAGLIMLIIVLQSVGLNPMWIAIILPVDRILDMCRTVINVTGDAIISTVIASSEDELDYRPQASPDNFKV